MTSRSFFGKMNSTLRSVVPLAMFLNLINDKYLLWTICRYLVCDMVFHFVSLPLIFYPMHFLWKVKVSFYKYHP